MMSAYETQYRFPMTLFRITAFLRAVERGVRAAKMDLAAWLEKRRFVAATRHEFESMSDRTLRDIGLSRTDVNRMAWGTLDRYRGSF